MKELKQNALDMQIILFDMLSLHGQALKRIECMDIYERDYYIDHLRAIARDLNNFNIAIRYNLREATHE